MKKVLIILPYIPYPLKSGGQVSVFEMVNYLRNNVEITLLLPESTHDSNFKDLSELKLIWTNVTFHTYRIKKTYVKKIFSLIADFFYKYFVKFNYASFSEDFDNTYYEKNSLLYSFDNELNKNLIEISNSLITNFKYDFVQVEFFELLPLICFLPDNIYTIFVHHEIRYVRDYRHFNMKFKNTAINHLFQNQKKGQEIELLKKYNKIVTLSDFDKAQLSIDINNDKIISSPMTIKFDNTDNTNTYTFDNKLLFLGGSAHFPNKDGLEWFLKNCWPDLMKNNDKLKLVVIGNWLFKDIKHLNVHKNVEFLGYVENLQEQLKNGILIVPLRIGSGMRMKIIDAVNYSVPFVSTTVGVEGLNFLDNMHCYIADEPSIFTSKLLDLIDDKVKQKIFIDNSKRLLHRDYSYEISVKKREQIYI